MKNDIKSYKMTIFNSHYTLLSDEHEDCVVKSAHYVDEIMKDIADKFRLQDTQKIAVLTALKIVHKMFELESELEKYKQRDDIIIKRIEQEITAIALL